MRGRKPTPTALFDLHGRPSASRNAKPHLAGPKPVTGALSEPPDWMSETQKLGWAYCVTHAPPGVLAMVDRGALAVWVVAEDLHRRAAVAQHQAGSLLVKAPMTGTPMQSPYLAIVNRQGLIMLKAASELGFSPVSRPRVGATPSQAGTASARGSTEPRRSLEDFLGDRPPTTH